MVECVTFVGKKDFIGYVRNVFQGLRKSDVWSVKARGNLIVRAVDIVEVVKRKGVIVKDVIIGTESVNGCKVSCIEICLVRQGVVKKEVVVLENPRELSIVEKVV